MRFDCLWVHKNDVDEDIVCDICLDNKIVEEDDDEIVLCDLCNMAVHQTCYAHDIHNSLPEGDWYCNRCKFLLSNQSNHAAMAVCYFCNDLKGAMMFDQKLGLGWVHYTCVNWIPEIWFEDE